MVWAVVIVLSMAVLGFFAYEAYTANLNYQAQNPGLTLVNDIFGGGTSRASGSSGGVNLGSLAALL